MGIGELVLGGFGGEPLGVPGLLRKPEGQARDGGEELGKDRVITAWDEGLEHGNARAERGEEEEGRDDVLKDSVNRGLERSEGFHGN